MIIENSPFHISKNKVCPHIVPYYFGKYPISRILGKFYIEASSKNINDLSQLLNPRWDVPATQRWDSPEHYLVRHMMHNLIYIQFFDEIKNDKSNILENLKEILKILP